MMRRTAGLRQFKMPIPQRVEFRKTYGASPEEWRDQELMLAKDRMAALKKEMETFLPREMKSELEPHQRRLVTKAIDELVAKVTKEQAWIDDLMQASPNVLRCESLKKIKLENAKAASSRA